MTDQGNTLYKSTNFFKILKNQLAQLGLQKPRTENKNKTGLKPGFTYEDLTLARQKQGA